jgi:hypothetical protein
MAGCGSCATGEAIALLMWLSLVMLIILTGSTLEPRILL